MRLNKALVAATLIAVVFVTMGSSAQQANPGGFVSGEILVKFRPGAAASAKADAHRAGGGSQLMEIPRTRLQRVSVPAGDELAAVARYQRNPNVLYAEPNFVRTLGSEGPLVPSDYSFSQDWGLNNTGQQFYCLLPNLCFYSGTPDADIDAPEAWAITTGSPDVMVVVIDSGVDYTHPDLAPNYAGGDDFISFDGDPMDDHGHGTHVAGTIAAALNNPTGSPAAAEGVVGVAPHVRFRAYKVCRADGSCDDFAIQLAIARAVIDGAQVINMSLGETAYSQSLDDAVQDAWNAGLVIVAGAGNNGTTAPFYPAALNNVISVAAFDEDHRRPAFSNYGSWVDISAPGNVILSTYPMNKCSASTTPGDVGCYAWLTGTSMATPHVAGAAALLWSRGMSHNSQVVDALLGSADGNGVGGTRLDSFTIHGGLNLHAALTYSVTMPVAKAGADQTLTDNDEDGVAIVTLDGSASFDPNGTIVSYAWREGTTPIGSAATVVVSLPVGIHTLTLQVTDNDGEIAIDTSTVTVHPPRQVTVTAPTPQATEAGLSPGVLRFSRTGDTGAPLTVQYKVEGTATAWTDYQALSGQITINSGSSEAEIAVTPINDSESEGNETVVVTILADSGYFLGLPISATVTIVSDDLPADLIVSAMTAPSTAAAGSTFSVSDTTKNQGGGNGGGSTTRFYLSMNSTLDGADVILGSRAVPPLAAGASDAATTSLTVPAGTATGSYFVIAQADSTNVVAETTETNNNTSSGSFKVGPDLTVSALTVPATAGAGIAFSVSDTTKNQGAGDGEGSTTRFYLSTNSSLDGADVILGSRAVPPLAAGVSDTAATALTIPAGTATGTYYVIAQADTANAVVETTETNNYRGSSAVRVGPDLVVSAVTAPATAAPGGTFTVSDTTKNQGAGNGDESTTRFYLSTNSTLDGADVLLGSRAVPPVAAGASDAATTSLTLPAGTGAGNYYVIAQADGANEVLETTESNNTKASGVFNVGPDLIVSAMSAPTSAATGATITVTDTTRNQGAGAAVPSSTGYYLSTNSAIGSGDVFLGSRPVDAIAPGGTAAGSAQLQIPVNTAPGFYYIVARADWNSLVAETAETNNDRASGTIKIGPDLVVAAIGAPSIAMANGPIAITDTTTNSGTAPTPESATGFYLSLNSTLDSSDVFLGSRTVGPLGGSQTSSASTQVVIPAGTASGNYFVIGAADWNGAVPEITESNNTRAFGYLRVGPDVTVTAVTGPSSAVAGTSITAGDTTKNVGGDTMPASVTSFYLSTNSVIDASDAFLGSRPVPSLAPGASNTGSVSLLIPATTGAGTRYIIAKADGDNTTVEPQENNNTRIKSISITAAP